MGYSILINLTHLLFRKPNQSINSKTAAKPQGVPHAQTAKHALYHHPRQLSAQGAGDAGGGAGAQEGGAVAGAFHRAYFLFWQCAGVAVFAGVLR